MESSAEPVWATAGTATDTVTINKQKAKPGLQKPEVRLIFIRVGKVAEPNKRSFA
jgi:hypothetical protein